MEKLKGGTCSDLDRTCEKLILNHFASSYRMFDETIKLYRHQEKGQRQDEEFNLDWILDIKDAVFTKFRLECHREPELQMQSIDLSHWEEKLQKHVNELSKQIYFKQSCVENFRNKMKRRSNSLNVPQVIASFCVTNKESQTKSFNSPKSCYYEANSRKGNGNSKMVKLWLKLDEFEKNGISTNDAVNAKEIRHELDLSFQSSLQEIYNTKDKQQAAMLELIETEGFYLRNIGIVLDVFFAVLKSLQSINVLTEVKSEKLFSNINQIYYANLELWTNGILPLTKYTTESKELNIAHSQLKNIFLEIKVRFLPYIKYCLGLKKCQAYLTSLSNRNKYFKTYLNWCESRKSCKRLKLRDFLAFPFQRITKYPLLLKAILTYTNDHEEILCLKEMLVAVEEFINQINLQMKEKENYEKFKNIARRIQPYQNSVQVTDPELKVLVNKYRKLDLSSPMLGCDLQRKLIYDCHVNLLRCGSSLIDVHCFIFTDLLLICNHTHSSTERINVLYPPLLLERVILKQLRSNPEISIGLIYLDEFGTSTLVLTLYFQSRSLSKSFMDSIQIAQEIYKDAKKKDYDIQSAKSEGNVQSLLVPEPPASQLSCYNNMKKTLMENDSKHKMIKENDIKMNR